MLFFLPGATFVGRRSGQAQSGHWRCRSSAAFCVFLILHPQRSPNWKGKSSEPNLHVYFSGCSWSCFVWRTKNKIWIHNLMRSYELERDWPTEPLLGWYFWGLEHPEMVGCFKNTVDRKNPAPPGMYKTIIGLNWCRISSINSNTRSYGSYGRWFLLCFWRTWTYKCCIILPILSQRMAHP